MSHIFNVSNFKELRYIKYILFIVFQDQTRFHFQFQFKLNNLIAKTSCFRTKWDLIVLFETILLHLL